MQVQELNWNGEFIYPNMITIDDNIHDGSCLFHSICMAIYKPYQLNTIDRKQHVVNLRRTLSKKLPYYYDHLADGKLEDLSIDVPTVSLEYMQKELNSTRYLSNIYNEYISEVLNVDIYLLDANREDVYTTGTDLRLLYKDRLSIVILYINNNHYQVVGLKDNKGDITVSFKHDHDFITLIKSQTRKKIF